MPDLPPNVKVIQQPVTGAGNDAADWQDDPDAVNQFMQSVDDATKETDTSPDPDELINELLGGLRVSEAQAAEFCDPNWVYQNLIIEGHITTIPAEPNGGKTTLLWNLCPILAKNGYDVVYVNADISGGDAKQMIPVAKANGIDLLLPDMGAALGMPFVVEQLEKMARAGTRFDRKVFIFDTLKKMMPPNSKEGMRELFQTLRALSAQGMTIVLLAHTLKYYNEEGLPVFEGVGDIRADTDELIYLLPKSEPDGSKIISTFPDKVRGEFQAISFRLNQDRTVTPLQHHIDLKAVKAAEAIYEHDREDIEEIHEYLRDGARKQKDIYTDTSLSKGRAIKILRRYRDKQWAEDSRENNAKFYQSLPPHKRTPAEVGGEVFDGKPGGGGKQANRQAENLAEVGL